jgi:uncharacterized membrane protein
MGFFKRVLSRTSIFRELLGFLWTNKLWWLIPLIVILVAVGVLLIFAQSSSLAPFIYTLF